MLSPIALISNSRALTKADTSRSPSLLRALSVSCVRIVLALEILTRLVGRWILDEVFADPRGCLRFCGADTPGAVIAGKTCHLKYIALLYETLSGVPNFQANILALGSTWT